MTIAFQHLIRKPNGDVEIGSTGIRVYTVLGCHRSDDTPEEIAEAYELPVAAVYEALTYAADHPGEMEAIGRTETAITLELLSSVSEDVRRGSDLP